MITIRGRRALGGTVIALFVTTQAVTAATWYAAACGDNRWSGTSDVCAGPDGPKKTIQAAIDLSVDGDLIIVLDGTYAGPANNYLDFKGKTLVIRSANGAEFTTIDGGFTARAFDFGDGEYASVQGFTFANGQSYFGGGSVRVGSGATATFRDCIFRNGLARRYGGGAVWVDGGQAEFLDCTFEENTSLWAAGAALVDGGGDPVVFQRCVFRRNAATTPYGGGAITGNNLRIIGCLFEENDADSGGALDDVNNAIIADCVFRGNTSIEGGAIAVRHRSPIDRCVFDDNRAVRGGAIHVELTISPPITNCLFVDNQADRGGAIFNGDRGSPLIIGCTLVENTAGIGGAIASQSSTFAARPVISNIVSWGNGPSQIIDVGSAATTISYSDIEGGWTGLGTNNIDADPLFVADDDWRLGPGSPCIDAGDNNAVPDGIFLDLDLGPRFVDDPDTIDTGAGTPPIVDMGAYELRIGCVADLDGSGAVDFGDILAILSAWGNAGGPADLDGSGTVDFGDLVVVLANWGTC